MRAVRESQRPRAAWRMAAVLAMLTLLLGGVYAASAHREKQQRMRALRTERQQIESELQRVKAIADDVQPVVVLENDHTRVIVHLNESRNANQQAKLIYY